MPLSERGVALPLPRRCNATHNTNSRARATVHQVQKFGTRRKRCMPLRPRGWAGGSTARASFMPRPLVGCAALVKRLVPLSTRARRAIYVSFSYRVCMLPRWRVLCFSLHSVPLCAEDHRCLFVASNVHAQQHVASANTRRTPAPVCEDAHRVHMLCFALLRAAATRHAFRFQLGIG